MNIFKKYPKLCQETKSKYFYIRNYKNELATMNKGFSLFKTIESLLAAYGSQKITWVKAIWYKKEEETVLENIDEKFQEDNAEYFI